VEAIKLTEAFLMKWAGYLTVCISSDVRTPACTPFWIWVAYILMAIGIISVTALLVSFISYKLKYRAALRAQAERDRIPDEETMKQYRWVGDEAHVQDDTNAEVRIRNAIAAQRSTNTEPVA
jgi:hypothetical protein